MNTNPIKDKISNEWVLIALLIWVSRKLSKIYPNRPNPYILKKLKKKKYKSKLRLHPQGWRNQTRFKK